MTIKEFQSRLTEAAEEITALNLSRVLLLHHNDTDGISAGIILEHAFSRLDYSVSRYCLEKPYPQVVKKLLSDPTLTKDALIVLTDFGSGMLSILENANKFKRPIYLLDHHTLEDKSGSELFPVNGVSFGLSGVLECCAASISAQFAIYLDQRNSDLLKFGVLGAVGDSQISDQGRLEGLNAVVLRLAEDNGDVRREGRDLYLHFGRWLEAKTLKNLVDALGSVGDLRQGPDVAFKGLYEGFDERYETVARGFLGEFEERRDLFLRAGKLNLCDQTVWFELGEDFSEMGVKTVGLIAEAVSQIGKYTDNYVVGFQSIPEQIPGLGKVGPSEDKLSLRVGAALFEEIRVGRKPPLPKILAKISEQLNGFVDAGHPHAAAITLPPGKRREFIDSFENYLENWFP